MFYMQWTVRTVKHLIMQFQHTRPHSACNYPTGRWCSLQQQYLIFSSPPTDKLSVSIWQYAAPASFLILSNSLFSNRPTIWRYTLWPADNLTIHTMSYWQFDDSHWATDNLTIHTMSYWQFDDTHYELLKIWRYTLWATDNLTIHTMCYWKFDDSHYELLTIWRYTLWAADNLTIRAMSYWQFDDTRYDLLTIWRCTLWATENLTIRAMSYWQFGDTCYDLPTIWRYTLWATDNLWRTVILLSTETPNCYKIERTLPASPACMIP